MIRDQQDKGLQQRGVDSVEPVNDMVFKTYRIPTNSRERDGTLEWEHTTLVYVEVKSGSGVGIGYTYANRATAVLFMII